MENLLVGCLRRLSARHGMARRASSRAVLLSLLGAKRVSTGAVEGTPNVVSEEV
jgi:hypothetical protein